MNAVTLELAVMSLWRDARLIGSAPKASLSDHLSALVEIQDEVAIAVEKAREVSGRPM